MSPSGRPTLAIYWAAGCGGCEVSLLNLGEGLLDLERTFEIAFFPCLCDAKRADLEARPDRSIDLCLLNGAIRTAADEEMARLLRRTSRLLVAYGSCAHEGCIPALANLGTVRETLGAVYGPSGEENGRWPRETSRVAEGELRLPRLLEAVQALDGVVEVDYTIPGCPPEPGTIRAALEPLVASLAGTAPAPPARSVLGARSTALCEECPLPRTESRVARFFRAHEVVPRPGVCLLEQGLVCLGVATRGGCGALCPKVGMACRGCYGPLDGVRDIGAKMVDALAAVLDLGPTDEESGTLTGAASAAVETLVDPAGTLYRHALAHALLSRCGTDALDRLEEGPRGADHD